VLLPLLTPRLLLDRNQSGPVPYGAMPDAKTVGFTITILTDA
jgi:hypothetical protein